MSHDQPSATPEANYIASETEGLEDANLRAALHENAASQLADMVVDSLPSR